MLNSEGKEGWMLITIIPRRTEEGEEKWVLYFMRETEKIPVREEDIQTLRETKVDSEPDDLGKLAEHGHVPLGFADQFNSPTGPKDTS
jgi:hypothetical protein